MPTSKILQLCLLALAPWAPWLCVQDTPSDSSTALFKKAQTAAANKKAEDATLLFLQARRVAARDPTRLENTSILSMVEDELKLVNPLQELDAATRSTSARRLLAIAQRYRKKRWKMTAQPFFALAMQMNPLLILKVRPNQPGEDIEGGAYEIVQHFPKLRGPWGAKGWLVEKGTYVAPWNNKKEISAILSPLAHVPGYRITTDIKIEGVDDQAGLFVAFRDGRDHQCIAVTLETEGMRSIQLCRARTDKDEYQEEDLAWQTPPAKNIHDWFQLVVEVRPGEISFGVDEEPLRVRPLPDLDLSGKIALYAVSGTTDRTHARFRNFRLRRLSR